MSYGLNIIFVSDRLFEFDAGRDLLIKDLKFAPYRYLTWRSYDQITPRGYLWSTARRQSGVWKFTTIGKQTEDFVGVAQWLESQLETASSLGPYHRSMFDRIVGQETESWPHLREHIAKMQKFMEVKYFRPDWAAELDPLIEGRTLIDACQVANQKFLGDLMEIRSARPAPYKRTQA